MAEDERGELFESVAFTIIPSDTLEDADKVRAFPLRMSLD